MFCKDFHQIDVFEKAGKKRIWDPFWEAKATKNSENIALRNIILSNIDFSAFFDRF